MDSPRRSRDMFADIFLLQEYFEGRVEPFLTLPIKELSEQNKQRLTLDFINHCIEELIELRRECPIRKDWSSKRNNPVDKEKLLDEYVDVLHFYVAIALINGWTAKDIHTAYLKKNNINHTRQDDGY